MLKRSAFALLLPLLSLGTVQAENLLDVYHAAQQNDAQLRAARAGRDAVQLGESLARSRLLPSISLSSGISANLGDTSRGDYRNANLSLNLSHPLYRMDRTLQLDQAAEQSAQADTEYSAEEQALMVRVADAYFGILAARDNMSFVRAQNAAIDRQLDQAKQRFDVGLIAITAVHEAKAVSDQAKTNLIVAKNDLDNSKEALREIIQVEVDSIQRIASRVPLVSPTPKDIDQWAEMAQENNPLIKAASQGLEIARQEIEVQRSARMPAVDLVASHTFNRYGGDLNGNDNNTSIGLQLNVPLWLGGSIKTLTDQARLRFDQAKEQLDQQRRAVNRQVRDSYRAVKAGISAVKSLNAGIISAKSALDATQAGFEVGTRTIVDVLNSEQSLYRIKSDHASAKYRYVLAGLQLKQAAGVLSVSDLEQVNGWLK